MSKSTLVRKGNQTGDLAQYDGTKWGPRTIHNYFADGNIHSDALIDTAGDQDYDTHVWQGQFGTETLSLQAPFGAFVDNTVKVVLPGGSFGEGVIAADWSNLYGFGRLPAGRYRVGVTMSAAAPTQLNISAFTHAYSGQVGYIDPEYYSDLNVTQPGHPVRYVLDVYTFSEGQIGLTISTTNAGFGAPESVAAATLYIGHVMITEGDPAVFRDGDSDGWAWTSDPYESPSVGPQP